MKFRSLTIGCLLTSVAALGLSAIKASPALDSQGPWTYVPGEQGWNKNQRHDYYYTSQGSEMMPYDWFLNIETADSEELFSRNLERFGFVVPPPDPSNPDRLPLGFVKDDSKVTINGVDEKKWVGLTCAACHTGVIKIKSQPNAGNFTTLIIDGGQTLANFGAFVEKLAAAVEETQSNPEKFQRFQNRLLSHPSSGQAATFKTNFDNFAKEFAYYILSKQTTVPWGPGRVDAFGMIFNKVCMLNLEITDNLRPPNAPVSYPFLWNIDRQDHIQWHGEVENHSDIPFKTPIDRFGRNAGEVMGVFARIDVISGHSVGYPSTLNFDGLVKLENAVSKLKAPKWPQDLLGHIDDTDRKAGAKLYKQWCGTCHQAIPLFSTVKIGPIPRIGLYSLAELGTDPNMTTNVHSRGEMKTGILEGRTKIGIPGLVFGPTASASELLTHEVGGALLNLPLERLDTAMSQEDVKPGLTHSFAATKSAALSEPNPNTMGYEARPLSGIWATAPYLHNGSVPNLDQLLRPVSQRSKQFFVGSKEFDPINVGYRFDQESGGELYDTNQDGNHNTGHEYPKGYVLNDTERRQLIAYLKSL